MGSYSQNTYQRPYQNLTPLKVRGIDKAIKFGGYLILNYYHIIW